MTPAAPTAPAALTTPGTAGRTADVVAALQAAERDYQQTIRAMEQTLTDGLHNACSAIQNLQLSHVSNLAAVHNAFARYRQAVQQLQQLELARRDP